MALSERERRFVDAYMGKAAGNGALAAELAGYAKGSAKVTASRLLTKANVAAAVAARVQQAETTAVASAAERRERLTRIVRSSENELAVIKAIDTHNKMDGVYVQKHEHELKTSLVDLLVPQKA